MFDMYELRPLVWTDQVRAGRQGFDGFAPAVNSEHQSPHAAI